MKKSFQGLFSIKSLKNRYLSLAIIAVFIFPSLAEAQYDSTKILQDQNSYGFRWKNGDFTFTLGIPKDTLKLAVKDSNRIAIKGGKMWHYDGYKWISVQSGIITGPGGVPVTMTWINQILCLQQSGVADQCVDFSRLPVTWIQNYNRTRFIGLNGNGEAVDSVDMRLSYLRAGSNITFDPSGPYNDTLTISSTGGSGTSGISKVLAGYGQLPVNDSTTKNDSAVMVAMPRFDALVALMYQQLGGKQDTSTIITKWPLRTYAGIGSAPDSIGAPYASLTKSGFIDSTDWARFSDGADDTAYKVIQVLGVANTTNFLKGIKLRNYVPATLTVQSENSPSLIYQGNRWNTGTATSVPYFLRSYATSVGNSSGGSFKVDYSTDSTTWTNLFGVSSVGASFSSQVTATGFNGSNAQFSNSGWVQRSDGSAVFGAFGTPNGLAQIELRTTTKGFLSRMSTLARYKLTTGAYQGTVVAGSGGANGTFGGAAMTGGSGTGQTATITVSGGTVTSVTPVYPSGSGYKVGDILSTSAIAGLTGFSYTITRLYGDSAVGLYTYDSTLKKPYWNDGQKWSTYIDSAAINYATKLASGTGAATTISIPHGLTGVTGSSLKWVTPNNSASAGISYVTIDTTNVNIVYAIAPPSGTNNLSYDIQIKLTP